MTQLPIIYIYICVTSLLVNSVIITREILNSPADSRILPGGEIYDREIRCEKVNKTVLCLNSIAVNSFISDLFQATKQNSKYSAESFKNVQSIHPVVWSIQQISLINLLAVEGVVI